ncbi:MFS transporter [Alicyclobacillus tolerans]|uniref:MFS transporter n=1 Tax=Alicyclobacillus tolerans TaxID=90970 RepID=UPI001F02F2B2|nr:MFS transporter [Alicyclobacillus tolerans]MCF8565551.1 MFS transporter [Alicyclobacillus tolerans]
MSLDIANEANNVSQYSSNERVLVLIAACVGWGLEYYDFMILSFTAPEVMKSLHISPVVFGTVYSVQLVATAVGGIVFGWLADIFGRRRTLTWTILLFSLSTGALYFWHTLTAFIVLRFLTGLGTGGEWAIGFALLNEAWVPKRRGLAGGFIQGSLFIGYALGILVASLVPAWPVAFAIGAVPALGALWVRIYTPESKQWMAYMEKKRRNELPVQVAHQAKHTPLVQLFMKENIGLLLLTTAVVFGGQFEAYVTGPWLPTLLRTGLHYGKSTATNILYVITAIQWIGYVLAGWLSDKYGRKKIFLWFTAIQIVGFVLFTVFAFSATGRTSVVLSYYLIALGLGYFGLYGVWVGELVPTRIRSSMSAFAYSVGRGIAGVAPILVGALASSEGYTIGIATGLLGVLFAFVFAWFLSDRKGRDIGAIE